MSHRSSKRHGPNVWVVRRGAGFSIREERTGRCLVPPVPQRTAIAIARTIARANRSELIVQGRSGRIRFREVTAAIRFRRRGEA